MKILLIDDSLVSRMITKKALTSLKADIFEAGGGNDGIKIAAEKKPELIILDLLMPGMDGFEVLEKLNSNGSTVPVIILSADIQGTTREKIKSLGAAAFIKKPPSAETLLDAIEKVIQ